MLRRTDRATKVTEMQMMPHLPITFLHGHAVPHAVCVGTLPRQVRLGARGNTGHCDLKKKYTCEGGSDVEAVPTLAGDRDRDGTGLIPGPGTRHGELVREPRLNPPRPSSL